MSENIFEVICAEVAKGPTSEMYLIAGECFSVTMSSLKIHQALDEASGYGDLLAYRVLYAQFNKHFPNSGGFDDGCSAHLEHDGVEVDFRIKRIGTDLYRALFNRVGR